MCFSLSLSAASFVFTQTIFGVYFFICSETSSMLLPADNAIILNLSGIKSRTSSDCVPIEPVEPNIARFFFMLCHKYPQDVLYHFRLKCHLVVFQELLVVHCEDFEESVLLLCRYLYLFRLQEYMFCLL